MFYPLIKLNHVKNHQDYVDKVMHVHSIIIIEIEDAVQENINIGCCFFKFFSKIKKKGIKVLNVNFSTLVVRSTPCPNVKHADEWGDPSTCENGDSCAYCHTRTEQQFHPEVRLFLGTLCFGFVLVVFNVSINITTSGCLFLNIPFHLIFIYYFNYNLLNLSLISLECVVLNKFLVITETKMLKFFKFISFF